MTLTCGQSPLAHLYVNGQKLLPGVSVELAHAARVVIARDHYFVLSLPDLTPADASSKGSGAGQWRQYVDPGNRRPFFVDCATGECKWEKPPRREPDDVGGAAAAYRAVTWDSMHSEVVAKQPSFNVSVGWTSTLLTPLFGAACHLLRPSVLPPCLFSPLPRSRSLARSRPPSGLPSLHVCPCLWLDLAGGNISRVGASWGGAWAAMSPTGRVAARHGVRAAGDPPALATH